MKKNQLRIKYKKLREEIPSEEIQERSLEIANHLLELPIWDYSFYHLFLSISKKREVDTQAILHILQGKDKNIVLSKSEVESNKLT
ncbi:MAG TPA: 5-formyltetrahydrofolate cyclo-ligase, partial [Salinimicrobium sp.]|nr:5-formyltetrahydrofolate cyclo-ligase [Salinimicrobium sp.]